MQKSGGATSSAAYTRKIAIVKSKVDGGSNFSSAMFPSSHGVTQAIG